MKKLLLLSFLSIFFFSCQKKETNSVPLEPSRPILTKEKKLENRQIGDTIIMNFKNEENLFAATGSIDSLNSRVYVKFSNEDSGELNGQIIPDGGKGNIRFNQIIFPDQTSDGPFGMELKTPIQQKGTYILVVGHSQMADSPYSGKFQVQLEVKK